MTDTTVATIDLPCPMCATLSLADEKNLICHKCGYETKKLPLKTAYNYAQFVFRYGHQYKYYYEKQLLENGKLKVQGNLEDPHELHLLISLPLLSGIIGKTSWFLVKAAIASIVESYNETNDCDFEIPEEDIKVLSAGFREFVNNFADVDPRIRNAVFEEMFAAECSKKDKLKLINLQEKAKKSSGTEQKELENKATKMLEEMMQKTFKKIGNKPNPTEEELGSFWLKVIN